MNNKNNLQEINLEIEFSKCFRKLREFHDLTQGELAKELGISRQSVNALEKGKSLPSLEVAFDISNFFNTPLDEMLKFGDEVEEKMMQILNKPLLEDKSGNRKEKNMQEINVWRPFREAVSLREAMDKLLEDSVISGEALPSLKNSSLPAVDMYETEKDLVAEIHVPGMTENDINVEIDNNAIYLTGEKQTQKEDEKKNYYYKETSFDKFSRTISFPIKVLSDKANADFSDGILKITVPKVLDKKPKTLKLKINKK